MTTITWHCPRCNTQNTAEVEVGGDGTSVARRSRVQCSNCGANVTLTLSSVGGGPVAVAAGMTLPGKDDPNWV